MIKNKDLAFVKLAKQVLKLVKSKEEWESFKVQQDLFFTSKEDKKDWNEFKNYMELFFFK